MPRSPLLATKIDEALINKLLAAKIDEALVIDLLTAKINDALINEELAAKINEASSTNNLSLNTVLSRASHSTKVMLSAVDFEMVDDEEPLLWTVA